MVMSRSNSAPESDTAGVVAPPPLIYLGGLAVGFGLEALLPGASLPGTVQWGLGAALVVALVYVGIALLAEALWVLVPLPLVLAILDRAVIAREERYLERKFGEEYLGYKARVRRWV
jgi:protein-S-isoprenylcysteine O-methyltransferase Ste14